MSDSQAALAESAPEVFAHLHETAGKAASESASESASKSADKTVVDEVTFSQSEHRRRLAFNGYLLTVIYDLLVIDSRSAVDQASQNGDGYQGQIFDWKTHQRSPRKEWLKNDWQTRLYLYVLCETTDLRPDQISMTYWFVRLAEENQPGFYRFDYSEKQHQATHQDLLRLTNRLTQLLKLAESAADFPKVAIEKGLCDRCPFNVRCDRASLAAPTAPTAPTAIALSPDPHQLLQTASQLTADTVEEIPW